MSKYTGDGRASEDLKFVLSVIDGPRLRNKETQPSGRFAGFQQSALDKAVVRKKTDGLAWGIERACGSAQEPREAISPLRNYVATASYGTEGANGLTACQPTQTFNGCGII